MAGSSRFPAFWRKDLGKDILGGLKQTLTLARGPLGLLGIPALPGAISAVLELITAVENVSESKKQIKELARTLQLLVTSVLTPIVNATKSISEHEIVVPQDLQQRISTLSIQLIELATETNKLATYGKTRRFFRNTELASTLNTLNTKIGHAVTEFQLGGDVTKEMLLRKVDRTLEDSHAREVLRQLSRAERAQHDQVDRPRCLDKTRASVLQEIKDWIYRNDEQRVYWLNGAAGTGKTTIALTIADDVTEDNNILIASFFCSRNTTDRSDVNLIFPSIAQYLADRHTQFRAQLIKAVEENQRIGSALPIDQLKRLIVEPLQKLGSHPEHDRRSILIIIDALDECTADCAPEKILAALASQLKSVPSLKVIISSRPTSSIEDAFANEALQGYQRIFYLHDVRRHNVDVDIRRYLFDRLQDTAKRRKLSTPGWPPADLVENLVKKAEGLFIFASTVCEYVKGDGGPDHLLRKIAGGPIKGLDALYREILQNASSRFSDPEDADEWLYIIGTIILLRTQLSLNDLGPLLNLDPDHVRGRLRNVQSVLIVPKDRGAVIRTLHASFHDFLTNSGDRSGDFFIDPAKYHGQIVFGCLNFITVPRKVDGYGSTFSYACKNWLYHLGCGLMNKGQSSPLDLRNHDELGECIQNLMDKSFDRWMVILAMGGSARNTFEDLDSVVCKLKSLFNFPDGLFQILRKFPIRINEWIQKELRELELDPLERELLLPLRRSNFYLPTEEEQPPILQSPFLEEERRQDPVPLLRRRSPDPDPVYRASAPARSRTSARAQSPFEQERRQERRLEEELRELRLREVILAFEWLRNREWVSGFDLRTM